MRTYECETCQGEEQPFVRYYLELTRRHSGLLVFIFVFPVIVLAILTTCVTCLPGKVDVDAPCYALTCVLTLFVYLIFLYSRLPPTGGSYIGAFMTFMVIGGVLAVVYAVCFKYDCHCHRDVKCRASGRKRNRYASTSGGESIELQPPAPTSYEANSAEGDDVGQGIDRASALAPKTDHTPTRRIPLVLSFHPSVTPIVRAIYRNVETLRHDPSTRDHFPEPPITAFRIEKNISKHLVRASQPQAVVPNTPGTFPCNRGRCNTCPVVSYDKNLSIVGPNNNRFNVHQHFTCTSANVVYVLVCKRCNILYVGETKRRLADRVTEHLRSIKQNLPGFPVATHFNPPSTCSIRDLMVSAAISCRGSDHDRLAAENRLIMKLGTLSPHGLNIRLELL
ncbi:hypothetical protein HOLleu_05657 [Holothuria leucospilota]|uniref:GIY-YIG domain-containing protein n=1 Tax=Holothuria leucospilota TaxID=206669 RepID=A0A9Q1HIE8_HOLLE|nr:hypothetical protein HOLleu_05657 [Holothuria leucospilota]